MEKLYKIIDVSHHNGIVDFDKVKADGIDGVIIRDGFGVKSKKQIDRRFEENYKNARKAGLLVGAYHYSYADTPLRAEAEARFMLENCRGKYFELPLYFDIEDSVQRKLPSSVCTEMVRSFCNRIESGGGFAGVYSYDSFFKDKLSADIPKRYSAWVARVENHFPVCVDEEDIGMWQYSWKGKVSGIGGNVDMSCCFRDLPKIIHKNKLNIFA